MSGHTPGPWHTPHICDPKHSCNCTAVLSEDFAGGICTITVGNGLKIGDGGNDGPPLDQAIANAHLIAAAPELLEALEAMSSFWALALDQPEGTEPTVEIAKRAVNAIARAKGLSK